MEKQKIVVIQGPTGVGKTAAVLDLARTIPLEIVNADSMQFYRYMDIGTSKPTPAQQRQAPHHLFSVADPDEQFDAARFMAEGRRVIADIAARGALPVVAGGTGLYLRALTRGLFDAPQADEALRKRLLKLGRQALFERLRRIDPEASRKINQNDAVRIVRALEVYYLTGVPLSQHHRNHRFQDTPYECLRLCLSRERQRLYERIDQRADRMIDEGLVQEVQALLDKGFLPQLRAMQSIGYRQITDHLLHDLSLQDAVMYIKRETRRLAKRQLTWFRRESGLIWIELPGQEGRIEALVRKFLNIV